MKPPNYQAVSMGLDLAVAVCLGAFIGFQLEKRLGWAPWGMVSGVILGSVVGFWNIFKIVQSWK